MLLPAWLCGYFGLPRIRAVDAGVTTLVDGTPVDPWTMVVPCCRCPPMGWAHSLWICQSVHEALADRVPGVIPAQRFVVKRRFPGLTLAAHTEYVDNFIALTHSKRWLLAWPTV